ncbi:hypothetical protein PALB_11800 [Pseudoalteromonas luteoviolacea B = ATCC 29581]|nr:hypothetical protein PALB_11800 [Pseudoalteromonas luteoviolacea B = ATCC 29581]
MSKIPPVLLSTFRQNPVLIMLVLILAALKFFMFPLIEWQSDLVKSNAALENRLFKANHVVDNLESNAQRRATLETILRIKQDILLPQQEEPQFKLEYQQQIESLFNTNKISVTSFQWRPSESLTALGVKKFTAEVRLTGRTLDGLRVINLIETSTKFQIDEFNLDIANHDGLKLGFISGTMILSTYMEVVDE